MIFDKDDFKAYDADLWNAIAKEEERQQNNIELIASENVVSKAVMAIAFQRSASYALKSSLSKIIGLLLYSVTGPLV